MSRTSMRRIETLEISSRPTIKQSSPDLAADAGALPPPGLRSGHPVHSGERHPSCAAGKSLNP